MKVKTIEKIIAGKMKKFVGSIDDKELRADVSKSLVVTGGCITSLLLGEKVNDYDVYLSSEKVTKRLVEYYVLNSDLVDAVDVQVLCYGEDAATAAELGISLEPGQVKVHIRSAGVVGDPNSNKAADIDEGEAPELSEEEEVVGEFVPAFISANAITLTDKVQIITRFTGDAETIHKNFDFVHAFNYWTPEAGLVLNVESLSAVIGRELIYRGSRYPLASVIRTRKFLKRGWTINAGQYMKMFLQMQSLNLLDRNVLEDQLTGVDSAYFAWFLAELDSAMKKPDAPDKLDSTYVITVLERIFG